jgi:hypothetical protein
MSAPLRFVFGVHLHQPVGNFDYVFAEHLRDVYRPFLEKTAGAGFGPVTVHISGPLFDWFEDKAPDFLDYVGTLVSDGRIELLLAGFDEPILASLPRADRVEQVQRMGEYIRMRFGVRATGLWLTERVWEPDLALAGVGYAFVDDRHFLESGFRREQLHQPWRTESDGKRLGLLAIDEKLRYQIPFRPPEETAEYLLRLHREGHRLAVVADDGEKFGGWPGTLDWVYTRGWLDRFLRAMQGVFDTGNVQLCTGEEAMREVPSGGLAYLPSASYREMESWALPPHAQQQLAALEHELGKERMEGPAGSLLRGTHWRNFLAKYAEANRMHKTMVALSSLCRDRGDPPAARRAIGRAQCNDAYWHGVFGGLYLPILRNAIWRQLAIAEGELRRGESLASETLDVDADGADEICVHSAYFSAVVSPRRGGAVEVLTRFLPGHNLADTLTRRREAYHLKGPGEHNGDKTRSLPPEDNAPRAIFVDRMLGAEVNQYDYANASYRAVMSWADVPMMVGQSRITAGSMDIELRGAGLAKQISFATDGAVRVSWKWNPADWPPDATFASEMSVAWNPEIVAGAGGDLWRDKIATVAKSERGLEETEQGMSVTARFPARAGEASVEIR